MLRRHFRFFLQNVDEFLSQASDRNGKLSVGCEGTLQLDVREQLYEQNLLLDALACSIGSVMKPERPLVT